MDRSNNPIGPPSSNSRWTCEACGCNTNPESDRNCTICGTSNGSSLSRRAGYAARSGLFARSVAARRSFMQEELGMEGYELWERADDDADMQIEEDEHAIAALAMEVAGVSGRDTSRHRSVIEAARSFALGRETTTRPDPTELLRVAYENASVYQPTWMNPLQIGGRMRTGNNIELGDGECRNVAHLPLGAGEGRALRALEAFPRSAPFASVNLVSHNNQGHNRRHRRAFGFRVAFEHPTKEPGQNMGGYYLVGVTTTSFAAFSERNALQQSPFFWGIEDCGKKYEGSRSPVSRDNRRGQPSYAVEVPTREATRNKDNVLFGSREVITCVVDLESRSLTFWRDEELLGTLITNLPRGGSLYPVVVPYNAGATVAITGMGGDPLPLLQSFATDWKEALQLKNQQRRQKLQAERAVLIQGRSLTSGLTHVLQNIFSSYATEPQEAVLSENPQLNLVAASRLWYRCGMKLSLLDKLINEKEPPDGNIHFKQFVDIIQSVVLDEESQYESEKRGVVESLGSPSFEIGDKVELVEGYERFGDAANGPLHPGERGVVIDLQEGPKGERHSVRVMHNTRRWWYQPQALVREKSGLTESPVVWFLRSILRSHGICHRSLKPFIGTEVTTSSWRVGDAVVPKKISAPKHPSYSALYECGMKEIGRIVAESSNSASSPTARGRDSGSVLVEYVNKGFALACDVQTGGSPFGATGSHETRRVPVDKLLHTTSVHGIFVAQNDYSENSDTGKTNVPDVGDRMEVAGRHPEFSANEQVLEDLRKMRNLDTAAIENVRKECDKNATALAAVFEAGLVKSTLAAFQSIGDRIHSEDDRDNMSQALSSLGRLSHLVARTAFPDNILPEQNATRTGGAPSPQPEMVTNDEKTDSHHDSQLDRRETSRGHRRLEPATDSTLLQEVERAGRLSSVQQRRSILLALMSRARRSIPSSDALNRESNRSGRISTHGAMPLIDQLRSDAASSPLGDRDDIPTGNSWDEENGDAEEDSSLHELFINAPTNARNQQGRTTTDSRLLDRRLEGTVLDSVLRGRSQKSQNSFSGGKPSSIPSTVLRSVIGNGLLGNCVHWLRATSQSQNRKSSSKPMSKSTTWLKSATDEDGMPLLQLAIALGCSSEVIKHLIRLGTPVSESEIKLAAKYNLPDVLAVLLQSSVYHEGSVDLNTCSPGVAQVIEKVVKRQKSQQLSMQTEARALLVTLLQQFISLCLSTRQNCHDTDTCSRAIADTLVGNVMLTALKLRQKDFDSTSSSGLPRDDSLIAEVGGRSCGSSLASSKGLLGIISTEIFGQSLIERPCHLSNFLLLVENYLCSKDINNSAIGLSLLSRFLKRFPCFGRSSEVERFGFVELLSSHDAFASNRLAAISSGGLLSECGSANTDTSETEALAHTGVVLCPKQHPAHLHVTLHSSFRCDLCGKGVARGRVMHGCRECDWDACERCTDEAEGGVVKWNHIRDLSAECQHLLSGLGQKDGETDHSWDQKMLKCLEKMQNNPEINNLSIRLLQRDRSSINALQDALDTRGELTMHQFISIILPALHASLLGKQDACTESNVVSGNFSRRSKKPRVGSPLSGDADGRTGSRSSEDTAEFTKHLFYRHFRGVGPPSKDSERANHNEDDGTNDSILDDEAEEKEIFTPELLRRLHQVLSLYENVPTLPSVHHQAGRGGLKLGELQSLTRPLQLRMSPIAGTTQDSLTISKYQMPSLLRVEPLTSIEDLSRHVLRTCVASHPTYSSLCLRLVSEAAILVERAAVSRGSEERKWRICKVISYNKVLGCLGIKYAAGWHVVKGNRLELTASSQRELQDLQFDEKEVNIMLGVREFFIISCKRHAAESSSTLEEGRPLTDELDAEVGVEGSCMPRQAPIGKRAESNVMQSKWQPCTVLSVQMEQSGEKQYSLVTDEGEVFHNIPGSCIRGLASGRNDLEDDNLLASRLEPGRGRDNRGQNARTFPFLSVRRQALEEMRTEPPGSEQRVSDVLKRSWSALSLTESMRPVELAVLNSAANIKPVGLPRTHNLTCLVGGVDICLCIDPSILEFPPVMSVRYGIGLKPPSGGVPTQPDGTVISLLSQLYQNDAQKVLSDQVHQLSYVVSCERAASRCYEKRDERRIPFQLFGQAGRRVSLPDYQDQAEGAESHFNWVETNRSRKFTYMSTCNTEVDDSCPRIICEGIDEICVQCMEIISLFASLAEGSPDSSDNKITGESIFANSSLSRKLIEQLDDPLLVAGGLLPDWCFVTPSFSPKVFSYQSRQLLLERAAFGVSRSTLRQQESKVKDVGRFRQRMASLRARAVELVGEAFSGGAEDPTALQLQADELYGMEEALAAKVKANFRAARWEEHALQVAKAAVNRDVLIVDAVSIMEQYANDKTLCRRRLEVRFNGESGFDAASGDEAGVTRGFYADVAEALLSCDIVAGVSGVSFCENGPNVDMASSLASNGKGLPCRLPLWIPDVDSTNQVIIPTPRADPGSGLGIYPRPLCTLHPQMPLVLEQFRFMGRLFASAMRDGFKFPLPLSTAFLKMALHGNDEISTGIGWNVQLSKKLGIRTCAESGHSMDHDNVAASSSRIVDKGMILTTADLPRPGFLGGEVYASEMHICRALDRLDRLKPPLGRDELARRYRDIAADPSFARVALGKSFDCSFEDYFRDRTFVDPLDPGQGIDAFPLCSNGHTKNVNIQNIREWVAQAKAFILHDGVIAQAAAFRGGVEDFFSANYLRLFTPQEVQRDVCGVGDNVDNWTESDVRKLFKLDGGKGAAEALVAVAAIGGEGGAALSRRFGPSSPTIGFVVKALLEATPKMRRQFLSFVTSVPIVTPGQIEVVPMVSATGEFLPMRDPACLPRANTCSRRLYLPKFETFESFAQVLWAVVAEESKFKGFYEWRGSS